jgi:hypothetical protein
MAPEPKTPPRQFTLRSLLKGMAWLALLLAICVGYQRATDKQRASSDLLRAAGILPGPIENPAHSHPGRSAHSAGDSH